MHQLPKLGYALDALEPHIDARTMEIHHGKHHATYVANLGKALEATKSGALAEADLTWLMRNLAEVPEAQRTAVRNNGGGHFNHTLFWTVLGPKGGGKPHGALLRDLEKQFGTFESFQQKFEESGVGRFGSGWAWLVAAKGQLAVTSTPNQENPLMDGTGVPILTADVWEHAYYLKYQNRRADYLKAFWNVVNWDEVARRYDAAQQG